MNIIKTNCKALWLSIKISFCCALSILVFVGLYLKYESFVCQLFLNISIGVFGSSIVALLMKIPDYRVSKTQLLEKFWDESLRLVNAISKVEYVFNKYDTELMISYISELRRKEFYDKHLKKSGIKLTDVEKLKKYKKALVDEYISKHPSKKENLTKRQLASLCNDFVDTDIKIIREEIKLACESYIKLSKESTSKLCFLLGDMEFFTGRNNYESIYNNIYHPLNELLNEICEECEHFQLYLKNEGSEIISFEKILEIQKKLFKISVEEMPNTIDYIIDDSFVNNMLMSLEKLRANIYGVAPENQQLSPKEYRSISKDIY